MTEAPDKIIHGGVEYIRTSLVPKWVGREPRHKIAAICERVSEERQIPIRAIRGRTRTKALVKARQLVMLRCHEAGFSTPAIGRYLDRDHTTVLYGIKRAREMVQ